VKTNHQGKQSRTTCLPLITKMTFSLLTTVHIYLPGKKSSITHPFSQFCHVLLTVRFNRYTKLCSCSLAHWTKMPT